MYPIVPNRLYLRLEGKEERIYMIKNLISMKDLFIIVTVTLAFASAGDAFGQDTKIQKAETFEITRIYTDNNGESHFGQTKVDFKLVDYAPPAPPISVSKVQETESVQFISSPPGWYGDWHPGPRRQFMFCLSGELEVKVSDGETRRFGPGCPILVEDTSGIGHISRVVGSERCFMAAIPFRMLDE